MIRGLLACGLAALLLAAAGCGSSSPPPPATTAAASTSAPAPQTTLTVFEAVDGQLQARAVQVPQTTAVAAASLRALGLAADVTIADGTARVDLPGATDEQTAEIVYTLTQYPTVQQVDVGGRTGLTRADVTAFVPPILIESPAAGASVPRSFHVRGSASVFEATLVVELLQNGKVVQKRSVTAAEGAPGRGPFDTVLDAPAGGAAQVVAFAPSAEDGSPQHEVRTDVTVGP
jgi:hypothetical protein